MACPRCGATTTPGQKFCAECGFGLSAACPSCGAPYEGSPKFCAECGFAMAANDARPAAPAPQTSERRFVTVLFADLVGFTTMSEHQDAEEVRDLLSRYFELAREVIDGYGGTIEKFIGDAVMAVWGAPIAREDDPERAVRAALELVERVRGLSLGDDHLSLRAGVLSGEAAVTMGAAGQGMLAGDLVNTASRLQSTAPAGVVLVGEATQRATSAAIAYEPAGEQLLKGKSAPVEAWRALRVVARVGGEGREEGLEPPFVGRDEELRLLKDQLHAAERERKLRMVAISGQAGIGKSRLLWELEKYLDGLAGPTLYYWHQGRTPAYGEGIAFWALGEMVRRRAHIAEGENEASTRAKLRATLDEFVPEPQERRWLEPALGALLGIDEADWAAREQLFSAWRVLFERIADKGPVVLAFEDLQWADSGLLDFIEHLLQWAREKPILIVTLARPELLERRPNFGLGHRALVALHLEPLSTEEMADLLGGLVPALDADGLTQIAMRAEGVPLYAVETVRSLVDSGHLVRRGDVYEPVGSLPKLDVPPTLRALIASRLDALVGEDRALLQDASVLGQSFPVAALAALTGRTADDVEARLRAMAIKELVTLETDPRSPERGHYRFRQSLIREISYSTLGRRDRRARHLAAARYFETLDDDELAGLRATHYLEAFRVAPEGDEGATIAAQARVALRAAADRAFRLHSYEQALQYFEQAIAVTFDDRDLSDLRFRAARSAWNSGDVRKAEEHARIAIDGYDGLGEGEEAATSTAWLGGWLLESSRIDDAMAMIRERLETMPSDPSPASAWLNNNLARGHLFRGEGAQALAAVSEALRVAGSFGLRQQTLQLLITKAWAIWVVGGYRESLALLTGAMTLADAEDDLFARTRSRFNLSSQMIVEDPHRALAIATEGIAIGEQYGVPSASMSGNAAHTALTIGDLDQVLRLEADVTAFRTSLGSMVHGVAGVAFALRGQRDEARGRRAQLAEVVAGSTSSQDVSALRYIEAYIAYGEGLVGEARRLAIESRDAYTGGDTPLSAVLASHAAALLGDIHGLREDLKWYRLNSITAAWLQRSVRSFEAALLALEGRADEALIAYRAVIEEWRAADLRLDLALTLLERARLLGAVDQEAAAGRAEARELFAAMGADGLIDRLESDLPQVTPVAPATPATQAAPEDVAATTR